MRIVFVSVDVFTQYVRVRMRSDVQLTIKGVKSVAEALRGFTQPELMSGENQINCEAAGVCSQRVCACCSSSESCCVQLERACCRQTLVSQVPHPSYYRACTCCVARRVVDDTISLLHRFIAVSGCKLDALKGLRFVELPSTLVLQLKRFDLDMDAVMRTGELSYVKLADAVTIPEVLDMSEFLASAGENSHFTVRRPPSSCSCNGP